MNQKIRKAIEEIERTKAKIAELQALVPELERKRIDMENTEIVRLFRSLNIPPENLPGFIEAYGRGNAASPSASTQAAGQEVPYNEEE